MRRLSRRRLSVFLALLIVALAVIALAGPLTVQAQGGGEGDQPPVREVTDDEVNEVSSQLYCPVCENIPLDVCGTAACARWRAQVRTLLEQGASEDEVISYFVEQFGQRVVATPQDPVLNFLSWAVPVAAVILGLGIVGFIFVRWRFGGGMPDDSRTVDVEPEEVDDYRARLERELRMEE